MTLAGIERRLAAMHQEKTFNPNLPFYVLFSDEELRRAFSVLEENP